MSDAPAASPEHHQTHTERLVTRHSHPAPYLAWCLVAECPWIERFATKAAADASAARHTAERGEQTA